MTDSLYRWTWRGGPSGSVVPACLLTLLLSQGASLGVAHAEASDPAAADTAAARALAVDGLKLAQAGRCDEAVGKLERAQKVHPAPVILGRLGECNIALGKIVEGTEMLRALLLEPLPPHPSPAVSNAYERAQTTLDAALPKIASLTITVNAPDDAKVTAAVDGQPVPSALLGASRPTNPGERLVEATAPGFLNASAHVTLAAGAKRGIVLELERDPAAPAIPVGAPVEGGSTEASATAGPPSAARSPASGDTPPGSEAPPPSSTNHTLAYVSWAIGGAALAVGGTFGIITMSRKNDLDASCKAHVCPLETQDKLDQAKRSGNIATVGFAVGAVGLVAGTVLYFTAGKSSSDGAPRASLRHGPRAWLGVGQLAFATDF